jgi:outer membrane protein assembly factor BamB
MLVQGRRSVLLALIPLLCSACGWFDVAGNPMHTGFNALANVHASDWSTFHRVWTASVQPADSASVASSVAVSGSTVYIHATGGELQAYDGNGSTNCSGTPTTCGPVWTASAGGSNGVVPTDPATDGTSVFVGGGSTNTLYVFDAAGNTNCGGAPRTCLPVWTASLDGSAFDPVVASGRVFVGTTNGTLYAFDAAGNANCGGTPRTCSPLWKATGGAQYNSIGNLPAPAVNGNVVYYPGPSSLHAYDATGQSNCAGSPVVCAPVWTANFGTPGNGATTFGWPVVGGGGIVYLSVHGDDGSTNVVALDAAGRRGCSGTPTMCTPLWTDDSAGTFSVTPALGPDGLLYVGFDALDVFSTDGSTGCHGTPALCEPLHTASLSGGLTLEPTLTNDMVVLGVLQPSGSPTLSAFKLGTLDPLASYQIATSPPFVIPGLIAIANGMVFESTSDGQLQAWSS